MPILPPWSFGKSKGPAFYRMTCPACGFDRTYELAKRDTVCNDPENAPSSAPEIVETLPAVCPKCGGRLKKEKIPVQIIH